MTKTNTLVEKTNIQFTTYAVEKDHIFESKFQSFIESEWEKAKGLWGKGSGKLVHPDMEEFVYVAY